MNDDLDPSDYSVRTRSGPADRRSSEHTVPVERRTGILRRLADRLRARLRALRAYWSKR